MNTGTTKRIVDYADIKIESDEYKDLSLKEMLIVQYRLYEDCLCFMGFKITNFTDLSQHHCFIKECDKGPKTMENLAPLMLIAHRFLNLIEGTDKSMYENINSIMKEMIIQKSKPTIRQYTEIDKQLSLFELCYEEQVTPNQLKLIKSSYQYRPFYR